MEQDLHQLIHKAKEGNIDAFSEIIDRFKGNVYRQAFGMVNDPSEAQDIAQEAFIKAYYSLNKLKSEYAFFSWLTQIVSHLCYDRLQKRMKEKKLADCWQKEETSSQWMEKVQLRLTIQEAMAKLSPEHREVIMLRDVQGFSYDEIGDILKIPVGTVKSRIHLARLELRNELSTEEVQ